SVGPDENGDDVPMTQDATGAWLSRHRPALAVSYREALPGASAAVLARLWGALAREAVDTVRARHRDGPDLVVALADGRRLRGRASAAEAFAIAPAGLTVLLD